MAQRNSLILETIISVLVKIDEFPTSHAFNRGSDRPWKNRETPGNPGEIFFFSRYSGKLREFYFKTQIETLLA